MNTFSITMEDFLAQAGEIEEQDNAIALARLGEEYGIDFEKESPAMGTGWYSVPIRTLKHLTDRVKYDLVTSLRKAGLEAHHITFGNVFYTKA